MTCSKYVPGTPTPHPHTRIYIHTYTHARTHTHTRNAPNEIDEHTPGTCRLRMNKQRPLVWWQISRRTRTVTTARSITDFCQRLRKPACGAVPTSTCKPLEYTTRNWRACALPASTGARPLCMATSRRNTPPRCNFDNVCVHTCVGVCVCS